jgi:hypothetical protein
MKQNSITLANEAGLSVLQRFSQRLLHAARQKQIEDQHKHTRSNPKVHAIGAEIYISDIMSTINGGVFSLVCPMTNISVSSITMLNKLNIVTLLVRFETKMKP